MRSNYNRRIKPVSVLNVGNVSYDAYRLPRSDLWQRGMRATKRIKLSAADWQLEGLDPATVENYARLDPGELEAIHVPLSPDSKFAVPAKTFLRKVEQHQDVRRAMITAFLGHCVGKPGVRATIIEEPLLVVPETLLWQDELIKNLGSVSLYCAYNNGFTRELAQSEIAALYHADNLHQLQE